MVTYDPYDAAFLADPYPTYAALRDDSPVHHQPGAGWVLSRYEHVAGVLRDWEHFSSAPVGDTGVEGIRFLISADPPDHTTLRRLVNKPFHPRAIAALEPRIQTICDGLVDDLLAHGGTVDLVEGLALPLPVIVIAELLGISSERRTDFKRWSDALIGGLSPDADRAAMGASMAEMWGYFTEVAGERRVDPGEDLISLLVSGPEPLQEQEVLLFCMLLLVAGNETTTNLLSNLSLAAFTHPGTWERLRQDPSLVAGAVEETVRYDAPVQALWRQTTTDVEIDGTTIPADSLVTILYASGNRDPRHVTDPDRFDVSRYAAAGIGPADHLGFGGGIHLCLGAPLARLEARVAIRTLLARTRGIEQAGDPTRIRNVIVRGLSHLPVEVVGA